MPHFCSPQVSITTRVQIFPHASATLGISLQGDVGHPSIQKIEPHGAIAGAGLRIADVIIAVNGVPFRPFIANDSRHPALAYHVVSLLPIHCQRFKAPLHITSYPISQVCSPAAAQGVHTTSSVMVGGEMSRFSFAEVPQRCLRRKSRLARWPQGGPASTMRWPSSACNCSHGPRMMGSPREWGSHLRLLPAPQHRDASGQSLPSNMDQWLGSTRRQPSRPQKNCRFGSTHSVH